MLLEARSKDLEAIIDSICAVNYQFVALEHLKMNTARCIL